MINYFTRLKEGLAIGAQRGFAKSINKLFDIMECLDGAPQSGIKVKRVGDQWRIHYDGSQESGTAPEAWDGTAPDGFEWETLNVVTDGKIVTREVLVKTSTKADVATWSSADSRLLLGVNTSGVLRVGKGYLKT